MADSKHANGDLAPEPAQPSSKPPAPQAPKLLEPEGGLTFKLASNLCWLLELGVDWISGNSRTGRLSPHLEGNYAPVADERFDQQLEVVEGSLPAALNGAFLRNGPNPAMPVMGGYHWFDGDGMVHCVRIKDGKAAYCNRFVQTARLRRERAAGFPTYSKFGDYMGKWGMAHLALKGLKERLGLSTPKDGRGTGNTALVYHAEKLLALHEGDLPYVLRVACEGILETLGRMTFGGQVDHSFTAHPKVDPETGELFFFGYGMDRKPYCWYGLADKDGQLVHDYGVPILQPIMMHDFAITKDYVIFMDLPLLFKPEAMVKEGTLPFKFDKARAARFGVLPRSAKDASGIRWFETEGIMSFHVANAWQEGDIVKLYLCVFNDFTLDMDREGFSTSQIDSLLPRLTEVTMDMSPGGGITVRRLADLPVEFPVVPQALVGRKTQYAYMGVMTATKVSKFSGIAKMDLQAADPSKAVAGLIEYGAGRFGGEAFFVPGGGRAEDDGHLLGFVHDEGTHTTELQVFNAKTMSPKPVARVRMPRRVPFGFHCWWISEQQLQAQAKSDAGLRAVQAAGETTGRGGLMPRSVFSFFGRGSN